MKLYTTECLVFLTPEPLCLLQLKDELLLEVQTHENEVSDYIYRADLKTSFELVNLLVRYCESQ